MPEIRVRFVPRKSRKYSTHDRFERASKTSIDWYCCSQDLLGAAAAVSFGSDKDVEKKIVDRAGLAKGFSIAIATPMVGRMLCGLAMELMFKAILVARREKVPTHHELCELAHDADVEFTDDEKGLLAILTAAIKWRGRYPIPKKRAQWDDLNRLHEKHLRRPQKLKGSNRSISVPTYALDWEGFTKLYAKVFDAYWEAQRTEPDDDE